MRALEMAKCPPGRPVLGAIGLDRISELRGAIWAARTRGDPSSGLPRKRAPIWSGASAAGRRSPLDAEDWCCLSCEAGPIEDVVSGADAWVAGYAPRKGRSG